MMMMSHHHERKDSKKNTNNMRLLFLHPNPVFMNTVIRMQYTNRRADEDAEKGRGRGGARFCGGV